MSFQAEAIGSEVTAMITAAVENNSWLSKETRSVLKRKVSDRQTLRSDWVYFEVYFSSPEPKAHW